LNFNLPIFLKTIQNSAPERVIKLEARSLAIGSATTTVSLRNGTAPLEHSRVEKEIGEALRTLGGATIVESAAASGRPDFVAWIPGLQSDFGNPVVIEAKSSRRAVNAESLGDQMAKFFSIPGLRTVIVTHPENDHGKMLFTNHGYLFILGLDGFKDALAQKNLNEVLIGLRNKAAHGDY